MTVKSNVNPNFPIPGIDQDSRGFRDNFATIKKEIENLQSKSIQLSGSLISSPVQIGSGNGLVAIPVTVNVANVELAAGPNLAVQYNNNGFIAGSTMYINDTNVGVNTNTPSETFEIIGNLSVNSTTARNTRIQVGSNLRIRSTQYTSNISIDNVAVIVLKNTNRYVGIGNSSPQSKLHVSGNIFVDSGTITANAPSLEVRQTWNNAGTQFFGSNINIIDTASDTTSKALNINTNGVSVFNVSKTGDIYANNLSLSGTVTNNGIIANCAITSSNITLTGANYTMLVNTAINGVVVTLPSSPNQGQIYNIKKITTDTNVLTIFPNGKNLEGNTSNITSNVNTRPSFTLTYNTSNGWWVI